jgi:DNA repair protein RecO (recombination protein O)
LLFTGVALLFLGDTASGLSFVATPIFNPCMLHKTKGIALSYLRYRETSIIARIYTEAFGIQSYVVNGVRSSQAKTSRIALFQPLTLLDLVVYHKNKEASLHRISELRCARPFGSLPFVITKSSIALFITEILSKTLKEEEPNEPLFQFLVERILQLDQAEEHYESFHLYFLVQLTFYLGFGLESSAQLERELAQHHYPYPFDVAQRTAIQACISPPQPPILRLNGSQRSGLLHALVFFYKIHFDSLGEVKSLDVLHEVLRG